MRRYLRSSPALWQRARRAASSTSVPPKPKPFRVPSDEGISSGLDGFGAYGGSISAFVKPPEEKKAGMGPATGGPLPCDQPGSQAALQAAQADYMASIAMTGKLPSPRGHVPQKGEELALSKGSRLPSPPRAAPAPHSSSPSSPSSSLPRHPPAQPTPIVRTFEANNARIDKILKNQKEATRKVEQQRRTPEAKTATTGTTTTSTTAAAAAEKKAQEAEDYYSSLPREELSKEEMWSRISAAATDKAENTQRGVVLDADEVDYIRLEEELREHDHFHYRLGEAAFEEKQMRRDYYAMWNLAMSLNKARWTMLEVHSQRGMKTTGAGMKLLFWKESVNNIMEHRRMTQGQFTDSHPVLRPFAAAVQRNPTMTKAFVRGFTDARLKVIQQPGSVQQLFDHFDKFYGYFFNSLLEVTHIKDESTEHMMLHIGRAIGLTNHCVMFWKKYARIGFTMLPADLCADNHVNLALLKNISLASRDRAVRELLHSVMSIAKDEMLHAEKIAKDVPPTAWPIVMECMYPNYYLGFLQRRDFNVSAMFADYNIENSGFAWYRLKKSWEWQRHQSIERLVNDAAPLPFIGTSVSHRGSRYKLSPHLDNKAKATK